MSGEPEVLEATRPDGEALESLDRDAEAVSPLAAGRHNVLRRLMRDRSALAGLIVAALLVTFALAAPLVAPHDPAAQHTSKRLASPSRTYPLGTDTLGRCLLSRLLYGARVSLTAAGAASLLALIIGVALGAISGYIGGWVDVALMRVVDLILAFPLLVLALAITGFVGVGMMGVLLGIVSVWWASYARIVRGLVLSIRERSFVEAARSAGAGHARIIIRHVLPNVVSPVIVLATLEIGGLILAISGLNFLGLGVQPPTPEWGAMLNDGRPFLRSAPQLMIYPGLMMSLAVLGFNLLGDGLRDALDPRLR